jgi:LPS sulfotransferase NodH
MGDLFHRWRHPRRCYAICAVARSGSHLLSDRLRASRRTRRPKRFFYEHLEDKYGDQYGLDPVRDYGGYVRGIIAAVSTPNAVFDFKLMGWNVKRLLTRLRHTGEFGPPVESEIDPLRSAFPRLQFIRLPRKTVLGNPMTVRQTDAISTEWEERYRALAAPLPVS